MTVLSDRQSLEALAADPRLRELERLISEFNIFEALRIVRQETRHSDFLAFLLRPYENHGLSDRFLRTFLTAVLLQTAQPPLSVIDIDAADLSEALVEREKANIDILVRDERNTLLCIIENKVDSREHSNQLSKYQSWAETSFKGYRVIHILLSPEGLNPESEESPYIPVSYGRLKEIVNQFLEENQPFIGPTVHLLIEHYATMLGRHIVEDSRETLLARKLYYAHKRAIDLIIETKPNNVRQQFTEHIAQLLLREADSLRIEVYPRQKTVVRFRPKEWSTIPELNVGIGWKESPSTLAFECFVSPQLIVLKLVIGRVDAANKHIRSRIYEYARDIPELFKGISKSPTQEWTQIYKAILLHEYDPEQEAPKDEETTEIDQAWLTFKQSDLEILRKHIAEIFPVHN